MNAISPTLEAVLSQLGAFNLCLGHEERCLGRVTTDGPCGAFIDQGGIVCEAACKKYETYLVQQDAVIQRSAGNMQFADWPVAAPGDADFT